MICSKCGYKNVDEANYCSKCGNKINLVKPSFAFQKREFNINDIDEYVVIDFETTGLSANINEIIEFCGIKIRNGNITQIFDTLVKPRETISTGITKLTSITNEQVSNSPSIEEVIPNLLSFVGELPIIGHNISFDISFFNANLIRCLGKTLSNKTYDTLQYSRKYLANLENHKLHTVCHEVNKQYFPTHRAYNDCLATFELFEYLKTLVK
jgi:DNA polymerase III epsilon subunit family exonuclease